MWIECLFDVGPGGIRFRRRMGMVNSQVLSSRQTKLPEEPEEFLRIYFVLKLTPEDIDRWVAMANVVAFSRQEPAAFFRRLSTCMMEDLFKNREGDAHSVLLFIHRNQKKKANRRWVSLSNPKVRTF